MAKTPPVQPNGLPILTTPANTGVVGTTSIYDWIMPQDLGDPNKRIIWYDISQVPPHERTTTAPVQYAPGEVSVLNSTPVSSTTNVPAGTRDHNVSPNELMSTIAAMQKTDPKGFLAIQTYLSSGVWGTVHVNGAFDHDTEVALGNAMLQWFKLTRNTETPVDFKDYLANAGSTALALGNGSGSSQAPFQAHLTDPESIRQDAQNAAQAALGKGLSGKQLAAFVQQFHQSQIESQRAAYNGQGNVTTPDLSSEANLFAQSSDPKAYHQNQRSNFLDMLANMLAGSNVRPETSPVPSAGS